MTREDIEAKVMTLLVETFELAPSSVRPEARLYEDLDLDSIDALDMMVKLQELMGTQVGEPELRKLRTVADITALASEVMTRPAGNH